LWFFSPLIQFSESAIGDEDLLPYRRAFDAIDADSAQLPVVATAGTELVGTTQLSFIPGLVRRGALRAQIEAVWVHWLACPAADPLMTHDGERSARRLTVPGSAVRTRPHSAGGHNLRRSRSTFGLGDCPDFRRS